MSRKSALLFLVVCVTAGIGLFLGSILGHFFGGTGLQVGAIIGGAIGVIGGTQIACKRNILNRKRFVPATVGGVLGLALAAVVATHHMDTPIIPIASIALIGLGAALGAGARQGQW
jgi:hypothetical protein